MTTDELVRFDVMRITDLTDEEYEYLKKHRHSRKMREECSFVNTERMDFDLVGSYVKTIGIDGKDYAVYKDELLWGFYERNDGLLVSTIRHSLEDKYGEIGVDKPYPINAKVEQVLNSLCIDTHAEPHSVICIVFHFTEKYVLAED